MKVIVSACLLGRNCKYSGGNNENETVKAFLKDKEILPVCPEIAVLPSPRPPVEILRDRVIRRDGEDVTALYERGVEQTMEKIREFGADLAILKARSPTCGSHEIYDGSFTGTRVPGMGLLARRIAALGIPVMDEEELERTDGASSEYTISGKKGKLL